MGKGWHAQYAKLISIHTLIAFGGLGDLIHGGVGQLKPYSRVLFIPEQNPQVLSLYPGNF